MSRHELPATNLLISIGLAEQGEDPVLRRFIRRMELNRKVWKSRRTELLGIGRLSTISLLSEICSPGLQQATRDLNRNRKQQSKRDGGGWTRSSAGRVKAIQRDFRNNSGTNKCGTLCVFHN